MQLVLTSNPLIIQAGFHALSDPLRLNIITLLRDQELCVCELCEKLAVKQSKLSFHLKILKDAELLKSRQQGKWIYYSLNPDTFSLLEKYLATYCQVSTVLQAKLCK